MRLVDGDFTERHVDIIVKAANSYLKHVGSAAASARNLRK
jgi:O-acetyl-ADP-ribose deacetylase (regulator of RNase III)